MRQTLSSLLRYAMSPLLALGFVVGTAHAQYNAGIEGTVTDTSGAVVSGATVTVTSQETSKSEQVTADLAGFYSVSSLAPGLYTVSASLTGFKTAVVKDVQVNAEAVRGVNLTLDPGTVTEQVTVTGGAPAIQTEDASLTGTITKQEVTNLPQFRGDPLELLRLTPGVFGQGARDSGGNASNFPNYSGVGGSIQGIFQVENAVQASANGSRVEANGYEIDGVSTNSQGWGGATVITPNAESVKEVNVDVTGYSAENAHGAGAVVQVVSQNGTNQLHGSAVLRGAGPGWNAFQRWNGPNGASTNKNTNLTHNILGSLGGPIVKDKLFGFFSFEHLRVGGGPVRSQDWVETSQLIGNFPAGSLAAKIFAVPGTAFQDPKTLTAATSCALLGLTVSPTTCQDSTGANGTQVVSGGVDLGSNTGTLGTIVNSATGGGLDGIPDVAFVDYQSDSQTTTATQYNGRVDFNATQKDLVAFSFFSVPLNSSFRPGTWVDGRQYDTFLHASKNETAALLWNRTINPTTINEARMNVTRWYFDELKSNPQAPFGVPQVSLQIPTTTVTAGFPFGPGIFTQTTFTYRDTLSKVYNSHVLKFGGELDKRQNKNVNTFAARPSYDFNNLWSFANDAPIDQGLTTFDPITGEPTDFRKYIRDSNYGFFAQDNWKARPNLTLTYGLRYDYFSPLTEKFGRLSNLVLGSGSNALTGAKIRTGGDFTNPDRKNFGPQLGFAWSPNSFVGHDFSNRFVLRGGVGLAYNRLQDNLLLNAVGNPPSALATNITKVSQIVYTFSAGGNNAFTGYPSNPAAILTFDPNTGLPIGGPNFVKPNITASLQNLATPYTWHYSLEGQYDLGHNWVTALSYEGSQSRHYPRSLNYAQFFTQNPNLNSVTITQTDVNAHYNALLARLTHRLSKGLLFEFNYRFSRATDTCSSDQQCNQTYPFNQNTELGPSDFDATHSITAYAVWELPIVRNRHDWVHTVVGGWTLSPIYSFNSGFPFTPVFNYVGQACNTLLAQGYTGSNCTVRAQTFLGGAKSNSSTSTFQGAGNFPNGPLTYFTAPPDPRTFATSFPAIAPAPTVGRNSFRGPRYTGVDVSLGKRFTFPKVPLLGENVGFEIKANAFNIFNKVDVTPFGFNSSSTQIGGGDLVTDPKNPAGPLVYTVTPNPNFGKGQSALGGRTLELFARFSF